MCAEFRNWVLRSSKFVERDFVAGAIRAPIEEPPASMGVGLADIGVPDRDREFKEAVAGNRAYSLQET